jgi:hypothetical protein
MNLKESFRYQKFLDILMRSASSMLQNPCHCLETTKVHLRNAVNPAASDYTEVVDDGEFVPNDIMLAFMVHMIKEREKLSTAISRAKQSIDFDIDAAIETNKFRQTLNNSIRQMLRLVATKRKTKETDYKFDINEQQVAYRYDVEITTTERYDRENAKEIMREVIREADEVSAAIDSAMINTMVEYEPPYDVNESFDDVLEAFMKAHP